MPCWVRTALLQGQGPGPGRRMPSVPPDSFPNDPWKPVKLTALAVTGTALMSSGSGSSHITLLSTFSPSTRKHFILESTTLSRIRSRQHTDLSRRNLTAFTSVENSISMTVFFFRSSQIITEIPDRIHGHTIELAPHGRGHCAGPLRHNPNPAERSWSLWELLSCPQVSSRNLGSPPLPAPSALRPR